MKIFHYTMHEGCMNDVNAMFENFKDAEVKTIFPSERQYENYIVDRERSKKLWEQHKDDFLNSDVLFFSDTVPFCRPVLENINKISENQKIFIWMTTRFDYANYGDSDFYNLLLKYKDDKRITFLYSNDYEKEYINQKLGNVFQNMHFFTFYGKRNKKNFNLNNQKNHNNKLFVMNYQNEKEFYPLYLNLKSMNVDFYERERYIPREEYAGPFDIETCIAVLHIPYQFSTMAQKEYMSLSKTYILPTEEWIARHSTMYPIWHEAGHGLLKYSEFYKEENKDLFVYFNDIEEIPEILKNENFLIEKGKKCFERTEIDRQKNILFLKNIIFDKEQI